MSFRNLTISHEFLKRISEKKSSHGISDEDPVTFALDRIGIVD